MPNRFSYIVTIHNSAELLERVLSSVEKNTDGKAVIIPVLDGCADSSEAVVKTMAKKSKNEYRTVTTPDVHEIRAINAGLEVAESGFCIILQDDVILDTDEIEKHVHSLWKEFEHNLGYVTFRMGCSVRRASFWSRIKQFARSRGSFRSMYIAEYNYIGGERETFPGCRMRIRDRAVASVMAGIKSPVCLTPALRAIAPRLDEKLAPYCYDDVDLSLTALAHGLTNVLSPIPLISELEWGGTRKSSDFKRNASKIMLRNRAYLYAKHKATLADYWKKKR